MREHKKSKIRVNKTHKTLVTKGRKQYIAAARQLNQVMVLPLSRSHNKYSIDSHNNCRLNIRHNLYMKLIIGGLLLVASLTYCDADTLGRTDNDTMQHYTQRRFTLRWRPQLADVIPRCQRAAGADDKWRLIRTICADSSDQVKWMLRCCRRHAVKASCGAPLPSQRCGCRHLRRDEVK